MVGKYRFCRVYDRKILCRAVAPGWQIISTWVSWPKKHILQPFFHSLLGDIYPKHLQTTCQKLFQYTRSLALPKCVSFRVSKIELWVYVEFWNHHSSCY